MTQMALITGGQRGIGLGIAHALRAAGFRLALTAEVPEDDPTVQSALDALGGDAIYVQHDLRDVNSVSTLLDRVEDTCGLMTTLISNAGIPAQSRGDMLDITPDNFDLVMHVNLRGAFFLAQATAQRMLRQDGDAYKSLIFINSVSASMVSTERAEYCISKAGAAMMTQLFAARLAEDNIGVFELRPGIIETDMTARVRDKYDPLIAQGLVPAKRWGLPADIGQAVVPLVTGQMPYSTGAIIPVDGGLNIHRL